MTKRNRRKFTKEQKQWAVDQYTSATMSAEEISQAFTPDEAKQRVSELEQEVEEYKKKFAEQVLMVDLLKKLKNLPPSQRESELAGLIRTSKLSALKKGPVK